MAQRGEDRIALAVGDSLMSARLDRAEGAQVEASEAHCAAGVVFG